jgi:hypothetical protein
LNKYLFIKTNQSCVLKTVSQSKTFSNTNMHPVRLAYQPPASSTFSNQQPASSTLLSEQTSTSHQPTEHADGVSMHSFLYGMSGSR